MRIRVAWLIGVAIGVRGAGALGAPVFLPPLPGDQTICESTDVSFSVEVDFNGEANPLIEWLFDAGTGFVALVSGNGVTIVTSVIDNPATSTVTIDPATAADHAGVYRCVATSDVGFSGVQMTLSFFDPPSTDPEVVFDGDFAGLCEGDSIGLVSNPTGSDPENQFVSWTVFSGPDDSNTQFFPPGARDPTFTPTQSGTYVLRAETLDCVPLASGSNTITIEVFEALAASPTPTDAGTCPALGVSMFANPSGGDGDYTFLWTSTPSDAFFFPNDTVENPTFTPFIEGDFAVDVVVGSGSVGVVCGQSQPIGVVVTVETTIAVVATADEMEFCIGESTGLAVVVTPPDGALTYAWLVASGPSTSLGQFDDPASASPVFTPSMITEGGEPYVLEVSISGALCGGASDTVTISVNELPAASPTAAPAAVCVGHATELATNPSGSDLQGFTWTVESGPDSSDNQFSPFPTVENPTFTPATIGSYVLRVVVTDGHCLTNASETVAVEAVAALASAPTASASTVCVNTAVTVSANPSGGGGAYTYSWSVASAPAGGQSDGFVPDDTVENPTFTPTAQGPYVLEVVVRDDGCDDADPQEVMIESLNELDVAASVSPAEFCLPSSTIVSTTGGGQADHVWSVFSGPDTDPSQFGDPNQSTTSFTPSTFGDYVLQIDVPDAGDCGVSSDTIEVTVHGTLDAQISASVETLCLSDDAQNPSTTVLTVATAGSGAANQFITWDVIAGPSTLPSQFDDVNAAEVVFTPSTFGEYIIDVEVVDSICGGEPPTDSIIITVHEPLSAAPTADPMLGCEGIEIDISANPVGGSGTYTFGWSIVGAPANPPSVIEDTAAEDTLFTPAVGPFTYTLALSIADGLCDSTAPLYFLSLPVEAALSVAASADFEQGVLSEPMWLHANATGGVAPTFTWTSLPPAGCGSSDPFDDSSSADPVFTPGCVGTYTIALVAVDTVCENATDSLAIDVISFSATPSADPPSLCDNGSAVLSPNLDDGGAFGVFDYTWSIVSGPDTGVLQFDDRFIENPTFTPSTVGLYTIAVSADDQNDALPDVAGQFDLEVSIDAPSIDTSPVDRTVCVSEAVSFSVSATGSDLSYQWKVNGAELVGETESFFAIESVIFANAGIYTCDVSNGCGMATSEPAELVVQPGLGVSLFVGAREDDVLREADIVGCSISSDLLDRGAMGEAIARVTGLATHPVTAVLYAAVRLDAAPNGIETETRLAVVDKVTGAATLIATMGHPIADLAFHPDGTLYAIRGNAACSLCPETGEQGEMFTVDLNDAAVTPLAPAIVFGELEGHTITFDDAGDLYHHGKLAPDVYSRLTRRSLVTPGDVTILKEFAPADSLTAMTLRGDLLMAAWRGSPSELWSLDHVGGTYDETVLGPLTASGVGNRTILGLAFACAVSGDTDCDGDVDLDDFDVFVSCVNDPSPPACDVIDGDGDGDVDLADWGVFQAAFTGSGGP